MKKIALLDLSLAFIFTLTACSPNANVSNQTDTNSSSSDTPADNTGSANTPKKIASRNNACLLTRYSLCMHRFHP